MIKVKKFYRTGEVAEFLGLCGSTVKKYYERGILSGYKTKTGERKISHRSILMYAIANKMAVPAIGMNPFSIVTIGLSKRYSDEIGKISQRYDGLVMPASSQVEFGILISKGDKCVAVVDMSIGTTSTIQIGQLVRSNPETKSMLLIAICAEDVVPVMITQAGFDCVYRIPFNVARMVARIGQEAAYFKKRERVIT